MSVRHKTRISLRFVNRKLSFGLVDLTLEGAEGDSFFHKSQNWRQIFNNLLSCNFWQKWELLRISWSLQYSSPADFSRLQTSADNHFNIGQIKKCEINEGFIPQMSNRFDYLFNYILLCVQCSGLGSCKFNSILILLAHRYNWACQCLCWGHRTTTMYLHRNYDMKTNTNLHKYFGT